MRLPVGKRFGPYEIVVGIGSGGMGEVYCARDSRLGRNVAIKVLPEHLAGDPKSLARFEREAKALAALSHPNILAIYDVGSSDGLTYVVTELLDGETLRTRLTSGPLPWKTALEIGVALADGLAAARSKGVVHRDLKPANVFLTSDGRVKILDFGLARFHLKMADGETLTQSINEAGTMLGTIGYMSPEQMRGLVAEASSDIFSFGCGLYEMVSGESPFRRQSAADTIAAILGEEPRTLAGYVPVDFEQVIFRCLEKNALERFQSARELGLRLREILQASGGERTGALDSLAVLPFANASADPHAEYFSDGITETIINNLSQLGNLRVTARTTVFRYRGREGEPQTVGRELNVSAVLTGKVVQRGGDLRIQAELVRTADGSQLWGQRYSRKAADIFEIEEEIAQEISETLRLRLTAEVQKRLAKRYTHNNEAYKLYLKGRYYWNRRSEETLKRAVECFEGAVEKDARYGLAWAGMADCYALYGIYEVLSPKEAAPRAKDAAAKGLGIDDSLAEPHAALGLVMSHYDWDWVEAEREFVRAIQLNPNSVTAHYWFAFPLVATGRVEEAITLSRRALEIEPLSLVSHATLGLILIHSHRYQETIEVCRKAIELDPNFPLARLALALAYEQKGMYVEAIAEFQEAIRLSGGSPLFLAMLCRAYGLSGQRNEAERTLSALVQQTKQRYVAPFDLALAYLGLGNKEQAFQWLENSMEDRSFWLTYFIRYAPLFDVISSDSRYQDLLRRMNLAP